MTQVRLATHTDVPAVIATVTTAFADDPAWSFMLGDDAAAREAFTRTLLLPRLARSTVWIAEDGAAVAMWDRRALDQTAAEDVDRAWADFRTEVGEHVWHRLETYEEALEDVAPPRPYWYLGVLATRPDAQGRGLASALLPPTFGASADDGWDCWLETSTAANKAFYERRGFSESIEVDVPGGPRTWWLRRPATAG